MVSLEGLIVFTTSNFVGVLGVTVDGQNPA